MRRRRGFGIVEIMVSIGIIAMAVFGTLGLFIDGLRSYAKTTADLNNDQPTWQTIRRICENLKSGMSATVSNNGNTLTFTVPKVSNSVDAVTGENEYVSPLIADGLTHSYTVSAGKLIEQPSGRTLLGGISSTDPDPTSSQHNQTYTPFAVTTVGSRQAITINFITSALVDRRVRYSRQKTTVVLQNIR